MSYQLNKKLADLEPYSPIVGDYKIRLDANESSYSLNKEILEEINDSINNLAINRYPDPYSKKAVKAFCDFYNLSEDFVTAGNGSDELISIITSCFLEKGDKVVTLSNDFSMYSFYCSLYEVEVLEFQKDENSLEINVDNLIKYCNDNNSKMLIFSNPCNPTSIGLTKDKVTKILDNVSGLVVLDEAYMDFWNESSLSDIEKYDNLIILKTCSKAIGLAGVRFGFAVSAPVITKALRAAKSPYNTDSVSQLITEIVFGHKDFLQENMKLIINNTKKLYDEITEINEKYNIGYVYNTNTNFVYIKTKKACYIYEELLKKSIAIRCFKDYLRISTGTDQENKELLSELEQILKK